MQGFKPGAKPKDKGKGGKIQGPGTGTSDSIRTEVPNGSYIMPADSTAKIGEKVLGEIGKPVPVNVSSGEYHMPPEQVHAVGAQVLDQMKAATHTPVAAQGFKPQEGELYFADGGVVESTDDLIARISAKYGTGSAPAPRPQPVTAAPQQPVQRPAAPSIGSAVDAIRNRKRQIDEAAGFADGGLVDEERLRTGPSPQMGAVALGNRARVERSGGEGMYEGANSEIARGFRAAFPSTDTAIRGASQNIYDAYQAGGIPAAIGATVRNTAVPALGFAADVGRGVKTLIDPAANALKTAVTGDPTPIEGTQPVTSVAADPQRQANDPVRAPAASPRPNYGFTPDPMQGPALGMRVSPTSAPEIKRIDNAPGLNSPLFTNLPTGQAVSEMQGGTVNTMPAAAFQSAGPAASRATSAALQAAAARGDWDAVRGFYQRNGGTWQGRTAEQDAADNQGPRGAAIGSSRYGFKFARRSEDRAADRALADRRARTEEELSRDRLEIDRQRAEGEAQTRGFEVRGMERVERLYQQLEKAETPEERAAIAEQLRALSGKEAPNRFTVVPGGQEIDPTTSMVVTRPARVFNNQSGQFVDQPGGQAAPAAPRVGEVRGGYRFKGGNPADQASWEKV